MRGIGSRVIPQQARACYPGAELQQQFHFPGTPVACAAAEFATGSHRTRLLTGVSLVAQGASASLFFCQYLGVTRSTRRRARMRWARGRPLAAVTPLTTLSSCAHCRSQPSAYCSESCPSGGTLGALD